MYNGLITTDANIHELITCPKIFKSAPRKPQTINKNISQNFIVYGQTNDEEFPVFITYSSRMPMDFSLGLRFKDMLLYRCNGFHGSTRAGYFSTPHHAYPHAHILTLADIDKGRSKKPSEICDLTGEYVNLQTALVFFCTHCGIMDYDKYFNVNQIHFDDYMEGGGL